jgi:peptidoglycan/xylan/chitin deacetylase (PgdA/CDA1 family)
MLRMNHKKRSLPNRLLALLVLLLAAATLWGCQTEIAAVPVPATAIAPGDRLISLFFDDGFLNQYDIALPVLREYGFRATFSIITGSMGSGHGLWEYMDKKHVRALADSGMNIASHTVHHINLTSNLNDKQRRQEIFDAKKTLEDMGISVTTMVYPFYEWNPAVSGLVREAGYTCARAGWSNERAYELATTDPEARYHVFSWQITNQDTDTFKLYLKDAGPDALVGLTYHFIADKGPADTSTPVANFKAQMAYLKEAGYTVVPLPQVFAR